jgi:hypothetical protein
MRLSRLLLENWRNFQKVDVALRERMFIVGPNASGKSNLLDAFRFLRDIADPRGDFNKRFTAAAVCHEFVRCTLAAVQTLSSTSRSTSGLRVSSVPSAVSAAAPVTPHAIANRSAFRRILASRGCPIVQQILCGAVGTSANRPDTLSRPKETLVNLVRHSRSRAIRGGIVPAIETTASVGPGYTVLITRFVNGHWRPEVAERHSASLESLRRFLYQHAGKPAHRHE